MKITVLAPAKINLSLEVLSRRADGYHTVEMVMQTVDLTDTVTVETGAGLRLQTGTDALPADEHNTAVKAAKHFCAAAGVPENFHITLQKAIPMQAGLAGGSADAAGVLVALNALCDTPFSTDRLCEIGAKIGADVPFCVRGGTMLATGIGTDLSLLPPLADCWLAVVKPPCGISTAWAYAAVDALPFPAADNRMQAALASGDLAAVGAAMSNHFERALHPKEVEHLCEQMRRAGALGACMTGSGSAAVGLFADQTAAEDCVDRLHPLCETARVCRPWREGPKILRCE